MNAWALVAALTLILTLLASSPSRAEEEGGSGGAKIGPGKAVLAISEKDGLRLSEAAVRRLGMSFQDAKRGEVQDVPAESLVFSRDEIAVYRLRGGWIKRVEVSVVSRSAKAARVRSKDLAVGDRVVVAGAAFMRLAELDVLGAEKEGQDER